MPKRNEEPEEKNPEVKVAPEDKKAPKSAAEDSGNTIFTEDDLRNKKNDELTAMLACYKVDPSKHDGKNTTLKLVKLFLKAQQDCLQSGKATPKSLEAFKESSVAATLSEVAQKPTVTYSVSFTKNMENYESLKVMCEVTLPVNPTNQELADAKNTMNIARELVEGQLLADIDSIAQNVKP